MNPQLCLSSSKAPKLTIVMPVYNEAAVIADVIREYYEKVVMRIPGSQFMIAEDGSTDGTKDILGALAHEIPFILISDPKRKGYAQAFKDALRLAKTDLVFFTDSDGQHDPSDLFRLIEVVDHNDIVGGRKVARKDSFHRLVFSCGLNGLVRMLFGLRVDDINSGFKLIKKHVIDEVLDEVVFLEDCVMTEFVLRAFLKGYSVAEVPVTHYPRKAGKSAVFRFGSFPRIIVKMIRGLLSIKRQQRELENQ